MAYHPFIQICSHFFVLGSYEFVFTSIGSSCTVAPRPIFKSLKPLPFRLRVSKPHHVPHESLHATYEAEAEVGLVECYGRGCRPVYDDAYSDHFGVRTDGDRSSLSDLYQFAGNLKDFWADKETAEKYYETALEIEPQNSKVLGEYAEFVWKVLANAVKAEQLFEQAVNESPNDSDLLARYADFLWQLEG